MAVVGRSSSAGMLAPVTEHISAATFPIACVDSAPPVPGRAGTALSMTPLLVGEKRGAQVKQVIVCGRGRSSGRG